MDSQYALEARTLSVRELFRRLTGDFQQAVVDIRHIRKILAEDQFRRILLSPRFQDPKRLGNHESQIYSQNGEDGIISEILKRISSKEKFFVEFGVGSGTENNTAALLLKGYSGVWLDSNGDNVRTIERDFGFLLGTGRLRVQQALVTAENVTALFKGYGVPEEFDVLSIDIDGNDYWVWRALQGYKPRVVVVEYNATFSPEVQWVVKYRPDFRWGGTSYFGASLASLEKLGVDKGYCLVGCDLTGTNAFFVRADLAGDRFLAPFTAVNHYEPPRYYRFPKAGHPRQFGEYEQP